MKYGLPYKGSKNKLAERIVRLLPKRTHLVDLFCEEIRECSLVCSKRKIAQIFKSVQFLIMRTY